MKSEIQIELENENDELHARLAKWKSWANAYETRAKTAENLVAGLKAEIEELRRTHAGGQIGVECAQLQAENNSLRLQLGEALTGRLADLRNFSPEIQK